MLTIQMTRTRKQGNAVYGKMVLPFSSRPVYDINEKEITIDTLENELYLIPAGTYPLKRTFSHKFNKMLPLVDEVPDRSGIRIHRGTIPEHSTGCILTDMYGQSTLDVLFNRLNEFYNEEEISLQISDFLSALPSPGSGSGQ